MAHCCNWCVGFTSAPWLCNNNEYCNSHACSATLASRVLFENRPALYFCYYKENYKLIHVFWIPQIDDFIYTMEQYINIRIIIIIIGNKKMNSIFDTESKIIHFMVSNKFIIAKIKCWPVFKQDPASRYSRHPRGCLLCHIGMPKS